VLLGRGPANADSAGALSIHLAEDHTVITCDRRDYSRGRVGEPDQQIGIFRRSERVTLGASRVERLTDALAAAEYKLDSALQTKPEEVSIEFRRRDAT
jgi:hypothetical protein